MQSFILGSGTMNAHYYNNLAYSMRFGQPIILDVGYEKDQKNMELRGLWKQFAHLHNANKTVRKTHGRRPS